MPSIRTSRSYSKLPDTDASKFAGGTIKGLNGNPDLTNPPVPLGELSLLKQKMDGTLIAAIKGGVLANAIKDAARVALNNALDKNASYVDINCEDDMTILLSSGYEAVSTNRAQALLNPPEIIRVEYGQKGQIKLGVKGDPNRRAIQGRIKPLGGEFGLPISFINSRNILFGSLAAGTTYVMQLCGLGGSTGQSDWSEPVTKIAL